MKATLSNLLALALFALVLTAASSSPVAAQRGFIDNLPETVVVDVSVDATTFRLNKSGTLLDARRGDGFIVSGKIYPGGTIAPGGTMQNPGSFDPRTAPGSIGRWDCRGTFAFDIGEILQGAEPHLFSTQYHQFADGRTLVSEGPEGGKQVRVVIGGTGAYANIVGEVIEEPLGVNATGLFNTRFTFKLKKVQTLRFPFEIFE